MSFSQIAELERHDPMEDLDIRADGENANRAGRLKRALALAALAAGGVATAIWIAFLGWTAIVTLESNVQHMKTHPTSKHAAAIPPPKPTTGHKRPVNPIERAPKHP
jgi:hypothetical protein